MPGSVTETIRKNPVSTETQAASVRSNVKTLLAQCQFLETTAPPIPKLLQLFSFTEGPAQASPAQPYHDVDTS